MWSDLAFAVTAVLVGFVGSRLFSQTIAQATQLPAWLATLQNKPNAVAWRHKERPITTINSSFNLNIPTFSSAADWIVGIKRVGIGEKERMYVGTVTWEDAISNDPKAKPLKIKRVAKMDDYPHHLVSLIDGAASFTDSLTNDQTLVIYLEVAPSTEVVVAQNGKEISFGTTEASTVIFDGEKESVQLQGVASLLNEMHMKKLKKELVKAGHSTKIERKEMK